MARRTRVWALVPGVSGSPLAKVGGRPQPVGRLEWPRCQGCGQPMRFLFQLPHLPGQLELAPFAAVYVFQCENPETVCTRWQPDSGANRAVGVVAGKPELVGEVGALPAYPEQRLVLTQADEDEALAVDTEKASDAEKLARERALEASPPSKVGGAPGWIQPPAPKVSCEGKPVTFLAQVDCEPFGLSFGDAGRGYLMRCTSGCATPFRFLSQSA